MDPLGTVEEVQEAYGEEAAWIGEHERPQPPGHAYPAPGGDVAPFSLDVQAAVGSEGGARVAAPPPPLAVDHRETVSQAAALAVVSGDLAAIVGELRALIAIGRLGRPLLAAWSESAVEDVPFQGAARRIVPTKGQGGLYTLAAATAVKVLSHNSGRLGQVITNAGTGSCLLYLQGPDAQAAGEPCPVIYLGPNGGGWDGYIGDALWLGPVTAVSTAGTTLAVAAL